MVSINTHPLEKISKRADASKNQDILLAHLKEYFDAEPARVQAFDAIIRGEQKISIRLLDFFVTSYAKSTNFVLPGGCNVFVRYKSILRAFSKKRFDGFCRGKRVDVMLDGTLKSTTAAQLNFVKWAFDIGLVDYLLAHPELVRDVEVKMLHVQRERRINGKGDAKKNFVRKLTKAAVKLPTVASVNITLHFD